MRPDRGETCSRILDGTNTIITLVCQPKVPGRVGRGADKATALGQAMAEVRAHERWSHPYHWGAFVLMGD